MQWLYVEDRKGQYQCYCLKKWVLNHTALSTGGYTVTARVMSLIMKKKRKEKTQCSVSAIVHMCVK
jgi:hypothetical protein